MKYLILTVLLLLSSLHSLSSFAQRPLEAISAPPISAGGFNYLDDGYIMLDDSSYLYWESDYDVSANGTSGAEKVVYKYDIDKKLSEELFRTNGLNGGYSSENADVLASSSGEKIFFSFDGRLYVGNGAKGNVELLGEFGVYFCCNSYGSIENRASLLGIIDDVLYFKVGSYTDDDNVSDVANGRPESYFLWQSDGTIDGTKQVPYTEHGNILAVIDNDSVNSGSVLYITTNNIWLSDKKISPTIFYSPPYYYRSSLTTYHKTSKGDFICSNNELLRIANDGSIDVLAPECDGLFQNGDDLYFYVDNFTTNRFELWHSDGTLTGKQLLEATDSYDYLIETHCSIGDKTYITKEKLNEDVTVSLLELNAGSLKDITSIFKLESTYSIQGCSSEGVVLSVLRLFEDFEEGVDVSYYYFDLIYYNVKEGAVQNIVNGPNNLLSKNPGSDALFVPGLWYPFFLQPSYAYFFPVIDTLMD